MPDLRHTQAFWIVRQAVRSTRRDHPAWILPPALETSVAKRAAGTLLAHVRASAAQLSRGGADGGSSHPPMAAGGSNPLAARGRVSNARPQPPQLTVLFGALGAMAREARRTDAARHDTLVEVLRLVGAAKAGRLRRPSRLAVRGLLTTRAEGGDDE